MLKAENRIHSTTSKITYEETFMKFDTRDTNPDPISGINFDYPSHWAQNRSEKKMIGIRSLRVIPTSHVIRLKLYVYDGLNPYSKEQRLFWSVSEFNTLEDFLHKLSETILTPEPDCEPSIISYTFNSITGSLQLISDVVSGERSAGLEFYFEDMDEIYDPEPGIPDKDIYPNIYNLLRFLNQPETEANRVLLTTATGTKSFSNVWNRQSLYIHSSFSNSHRSLIGRNNDFYTSPSKKYQYSTSTNTFNIFFTSDGVTRIFPLYCDFYFDLSFILNFDRSLE